MIAVGGESQIEIFKYSTIVVTPPGKSGHSQTSNCPNRIVLNLQVAFYVLFNNKVELF